MIQQVRKNLGVILKHPFNQDRKATAIWNWFAWQVMSRVVRKTFVRPFIDETRFYAANGMTGVTGNIYCGLLEWEEMSFTLHLLREGDGFVDAGANVGIYTLIASGAANAFSYAFEPIPSTYARLQKNMELNNLQTKVKLYNGGLSDKRGTLRFTSTLDTQNHVASESEEGIVVNVYSLDEMVPQVPLLIKMDVEGHEIPVINGARRLLSSPEQHALSIEWNSEGSGYGNNADEILHILSEYGYQPVRYNPMLRELHPVDPNDLVVNALFVKDIEFCRKRVQSARKFEIQGKQL